MDILKITFLIVLLLSVFTIFVRYKVLTGLVKENKKKLKLIKSQQKNKNLVYEKHLHNKLLERAASLLIQSEIIEHATSQISEEELLIISMSYRIERENIIKQLEVTGLADRKIAKSRLTKGCL